MKKDAHYRQRIRKKNAEKHNARSKKRAQAAYRLQKEREKKDVDEQQLGFFGQKALEVIQGFRYTKIPKKKDYSHRKT